MPEQTSQKRQTAYKVRIKDILENSYVKTEGWNLNYFLMNGKKVSRVNIIGAAVSNISEAPNFKNFDFDDGTARISIRDFGENIIKDIVIGDVLLIIGRPRQYGNEKYIVPEIIKKIEDKRWIEIRKLELKKEFGEDTVRAEKPEEMFFEESVSVKEIIIEEEIVDSNNNKEKTPYQVVYETIKGLDKGEGVSIEDIKIDNAERIINDLLMQGEVFELKPGKYKLLE